MVLLCAALLSGCQQRDKSRDQVSSVGRDESNFKLAIVLDLSGSFQHMMLDNGEAWKFTLYCVDAYFKSRIGDEADEVILCQISGEGKSLLWQGSPRRLRQQFPTAQKFRDYLTSKSNPSGSLVHAGVSRALKYVMSQPAVSSGQAKSAVFVLSDFLDNAPDSEATENELMNDFTTYLRTGGQLGLYYIDQDKYFHWREKFNKAGFNMVPVEMDIHGRPPLPNFEL
jgi:hypothetical protein